MHVLCTGEIIDKEQLILLPVDPKTFDLTTDPPGQVTLQTGRDAVVASGLLGLKQTPPHSAGPPFGVHISSDEDDDVVYDLEVQAQVGPLWRSVIQVSASVAIGGFWSRDSDEVDHSRWVVSSCTWEEVAVPGGKRILLKPRLDMQGAGNVWVTLSYQVVATGWLRRMPTPDEISADLA